MPKRIDCTAMLKIKAPDLLETPPENIVNLKNGLLNLDTLELKDHTPDHQKERARPSLLKGQTPAPLAHGEEPDGGHQYAGTEPSGRDGHEQSPPQ